jgi:putative transposase
MSNLDFKRSYRRNLPHIQRPGAILFVTFRLAGSLPVVVVEQWKEERAWLARLAVRHPQRFESLKPRFQRRWFAKFEHLLDSGSYAPVFLNDPRIADLVADSLHHRDGKVFRLDCFFDNAQPCAR